MRENKEEFTVYSIQFNGVVVYVGSTSKGLHRWTCHKTKARNANQHSRPIHDFMRENTSDLKTFPEFKWEVLCTCDDQDTAEELESYFQKKFDLPAYTKSIRPLNQPQDIITR
jgi:hypothetical protein